MHPQAILHPDMLVYILPLFARSTARTQGGHRGTLLNPSLALKLFALERAIIVLFGEKQKYCIHAQ